MVARVTTEFEIGRRKRKTGPEWFRGEHCNFSPNIANMRSAHAVEDFILDGWLPPEPFITPKSKVTAFGSCFAEHISNYLNKRNYTVLTKSDTNAYVVDVAREWSIATRSVSSSTGRSVA
jgi:hypothetical protein